MPTLQPPLPKPTLGPTGPAAAALPPVRPTLVWLASYPKSGNTWLRLFLANYLLDRSEPFPINQIHKLTFGDMIAEPYVKLTGRPAGALDLATIHRLKPRVHRLLSTQGPDLILIKTHSALYVEDGIPSITVPATRATVYLVRNPFDVADSVAHHYGLSLDNAVSSLCSPGSELQGDGKRTIGQKIGAWGSHAIRWAEAAPLKPLVLRYEDMLRAPAESFAKVIRHLGVTHDAERIERAVGFASFDEARRQEDQYRFLERSPQAEKFFRVGRIGKGFETLDAAQRQRLIEANREAMRRFGYLDADDRPVL
ncbi:Sulfotransferase domain-containing protein [Tistlia consotensis]|uniref:Sulfotransferase domain-containing protein n=1 Tax=Tistlia consotensis USBA 355 TaxID=560819 RepID=A0A1Y6BL65_9PROT|nr:sulfotransferase domain-containing protein [Tistlia consotensis]SMF09193.1 Sulfotransferase domain-containing protein [Tistlia consotensis USBA 355]SNR34759.1 Sulfotransferase domain-containing protein [Tistlia consotensis]